MDPNQSTQITDGDRIIDTYQNRVTEFGQKKEAADRAGNWISRARMVTFLTAVVCLLAGFFGDDHHTAWLIGGGFFVVGFFALVRWHDRVLGESERYDQLREINRQAIARVSRKWDQLPRRTPSRTPSSEEALACDLDLFGEASLFHLVCTANSPVGIEKLRDWFLQPADPTTVARRQKAVAELAPMLEMRQEQERRGLKVAAHKMDLDPFLRWAESQPWLARRQWLKWMSWLMPILLFASILLAVGGWLPPTIWFIPLMVNIVLGLLYRQEAHAIFGFISDRNGNVGHYAGLFNLMAKTPVTDPCLTELRQQTTCDEAQAWREIRMLGRITSMADVRFSSAHALFLAFFAWDFHVLTLLERWQRRNQRHARQWFAALAQWESLASLASLAHDHPTWVFPAIHDPDEGKPTVHACSLGHPLIPNDRRVCNDVTIGPPSTFLMVTGSNMAGKSTLLRAVGTNLILAQAGAPVCASALSMPPVLLATSMRIHDSLADGVSYYMAELRRLKQIVDTARAQQSDPSRTLLYLLDELLQGTNTAERQIAVRRVLTHLITRGSIGAISTHDLQLAAAPPLSDAAHAVHFRETIHNDSMTFDYTLREGLATSSNALKLLEIVGLNDTEPEPKPASDP